MAAADHQKDGWAGNQPSAEKRLVKRRSSMTGGGLGRPFHPDFTSRPAWGQCSGGSVGAPERVALGAQRTAQHDVRVLVWEFGYSVCATRQQQVSGRLDGRVGGSTPEPEAESTGEVSSRSNAIATRLPNRRRRAPPVSGTSGYKFDDRKGLRLTTAA